MASATMERPRLADLEVTITHGDKSVTTTTENMEAARGVPESVVKSAADEAPAKDPIPPPSPAELRAAHYAEVIAMGQRVDEARYLWEGLKRDTSDAKKEFDGKTVQLLRLMRRDPLQRDLLPVEHDESSNVEPLPADTSWRKLPVSELDVADHIVGKLDNHGITTLGDLQDHWKAGKRLRDFKGIGEAADTAVVDAFSEYGAQHPEVFGEKAAPVEAEAEPEAEDEPSEE